MLNTFPEMNSNKVVSQADLMRNLEEIVRKNRPHNVNTARRPKDKPRIVDPTDLQARDQADEISYVKGIGKVVAPRRPSPEPTSDDEEPVPIEDHAFQIKSFLTPESTGGPGVLKWVLFHDKFEFISERANTNDATPLANFCINGSSLISATWSSQTWKVYVVFLDHSINLPTDIIFTLGSYMDSNSLRAYVQRRIGSAGKVHTKPLYVFTQS